LDIVRKILILSFNTDWASGLKKELNKNKKIDTTIASMRSDASKEISESKFSTLIFEESFTVKNVEYVLRALQSQSLEMPKYIYLLGGDVNFIKNITIPNGVESEVLFYSLPMNRETLTFLIEEHLQCTSSTSKDLDQEFSKVLLKSTVNVLTTFPGIDGTLKPAKAFTLKEDLKVAIRGKIIIKSEFFQGSLYVCFPKDTYLNIYEQMTGEKYDEINEKNVDFAGEVANMVYGQAKKILSQQGVNLDMAIPVTDQTPTLKSSNPIFVIPFHSGLGQLYIKVAQGIF